MPPAAPWAPQLALGARARVFWVRGPPRREASNGQVSNKKTKHESRHSRSVHIDWIWAQEKSANQLGGKERAESGAAEVKIDRA